MEVAIHVDPKVFNSVYVPYLNCTDRYLIFYGGGSSGKSFFIAQRYILKMVTPTRCNLLCVRQTADTNRKSTFPLLKQVISLWQLGDFFKVNESDMRIQCTLTGNEIAFAGLDDVEKIKSITFAGGELTDIWVEEATECREADVNQLKVRLRGGKSKKQMVLSFNPVNIRHWIKRHFMDSGLATVCFSTYRDNKFLSDEDRKALEDLRHSDEYTYRVYCLGQWGILGKTVFDAKAIQNRLEHLEKPLKIGYFAYDYDGMALTNIHWVNDPQGYIRLYRLPNTPAVTAYCGGRQRLFHRPCAGCPHGRTGGGAETPIRCRPVHPAGLLPGDVLPAGADWHRSQLRLLPHPGIAAAGLSPAVRPAGSGQQHRQDGTAFWLQDHVANPPHRHLPAHRAGAGTLRSDSGRGHVGGASDHCPQ